MPAVATVPAARRISNGSRLARVTASRTRSAASTTSGRSVAGEHADDVSASPVRGFQPGCSASGTAAVHEEASRSTTRGPAAVRPRRLWQARRRGEQIACWVHGTTTGHPCNRCKLAGRFGCTPGRGRASSTACHARSQRLRVSAGPVSHRARSAPSTSSPSSWRCASSAAERRARSATGAADSAGDELRQTPSLFDLRVLGSSAARGRRRRRGARSADRRRSAAAAVVADHHGDVVRAPGPLPVDRQHRRHVLRFRLGVVFSKPAFSPSFSATRRRATVAGDPRLPLAGVSPRVRRRDDQAARRPCGASSRAWTGIMRRSPCRTR